MSGYIVPVLAILVIVLGLVKRVDVYAAFADGAAEALPLLLHILPYLAAMLVAVQMLRESGLLDALCTLLEPLCARLGMDAALVPLLVVRPFSGSAAMAVFTELNTAYGPDSGIARAAAILMGSSETIFYEAALYFGAVGVKRTRFAVPVALIAAAAAAACALLLV